MPERPKLHTIWLLALLRGLVDLALVLPFFRSVWQNDDGLAELTYYVAGVSLVGGILGLVMYWRMRGHPFRGILRLIGGVDLAIGVFLLLAPETSWTLMLFMLGLWMVVRGFAALWLGLSIVERPVDRAGPVVVGLIAFGVGGYAMFARSDAETVVTILAIYGPGSALLHTVAAVRLFVDKRRFRRRQGDEETVAVSSSAQP